MIVESTAGKLKRPLEFTDKSGVAMGKFGPISQFGDFRCMGMVICLGNFSVSDFENSGYYEHRIMVPRVSFITRVE